jgi:hypothetical protein
MGVQEIGKLWLTGQMKQVPAQQPEGQIQRERERESKKQKNTCKNKLKKNTRRK